MPHKPPSSRQPGGQRSAGHSRSLSTAPAVFGLRDSPPLPRCSTEDPAVVVIHTAEDVHPIGSFDPHRGVSIAARRRRPAEGDF